MNDIYSTTHIIASFLLGIVVGQVTLLLFTGVALPKKMSEVLLYIVFWVSRWVQSVAAASEAWLLTYRQTKDGVVLRTEYATIKKEMQTADSKLG